MLCFNCGDNIDKIKQKEFMLHQLLGFRLGASGCPITELVSSAGLTKKEWIDIKNTEKNSIANLNKSDVSDIDEYINNLNEKTDTNGDE